jgi:hypothetical protein
LILNPNLDANENLNFSNRSNSTFFIESNDLLTSTNRLAIPTIADGEDKILPTEQSLQQQKFINPNSSYDFFARSINGDSAEQTSSTLSQRVFTNTAAAPVQSTSSQRNRFSNSFYEGTGFNETLEPRQDLIKVNVDEKLNAITSANAGLADKIPTALSRLY